MKIALKQFKVSVNGVVHHMTLPADMEFEPGAPVRIEFLSRARPRYG